MGSQVQAAQAGVMGVYWRLRERSGPGGHLGTACESRSPLESCGALLEWWAVCRMSRPRVRRLVNPLWVTAGVGRAAFGCREQWATRTCG